MHAQRARWNRDEEQKTSEPPVIPRVEASEDSGEETETIEYIESSDDDFDRPSGSESEYIEASDEASSDEDI